MSCKVLNLEGERQARAALDELRELLASKPSLAARTNAMLSGKLSCPQLEEPMTERQLQSVRLPADLMERAEQLVPAMERDKELSAFGSVNKSSVIRLALARGLALLEEQYGAKGKRR